MAPVTCLAFRVVIVTLIFVGSVAKVVAQDRAGEESPLRIGDRSCLFPLSPLFPPIQSTARSASMSVAFTRRLCPRKNCRKWQGQETR